jgi:8-oxo-dGTP pyrophosphatase MutT (NUDIX family)
MGQRPSTSKFAPNVWVFPGGKLEKSDIYNPHLNISKKTMHNLELLKTNEKNGYGLINAAIRETKEETGLKLLNYNLEDLWVLARAITPTYQRLRFDTKFFVTSYNNFSNNIKGNGELHNLQFSYLEKALKLPLFDITEFLLEELLRKYNKEISEEFFPLFWRYKKNTRIISRPNNT